MPSFLTIESLSYERASGSIPGDWGSSFRTFSFGQELLVTGGGESFFSGRSCFYNLDGEHSQFLLLKLMTYVIGKQIIYLQISSLYLLRKHKHQSEDLRLNGIAQHHINQPTKQIAHVYF